MLSRSGRASIHVLTTPLRRPLRAASAATRTTRWLRTAPGATFFLCGRSSAGLGLRNISRSLSPNRLVVVVDWESRDAASMGRAALDAQARDAHAVVWSAALVPLRARGTWNEASPFRPGDDATADVGGPVASLTCARVRPRRMVDFYIRSFPALARDARRPGSAMVAGLGFGSAVPLRDACTISFWPTSEDVDAYAFRGSSHDAVQRRSRADDWMSQSLFARFAVTDHAGTWAGIDPLASPS